MSVLRSLAVAVALVMLPSSLRAQTETAKQAFATGKRAFDAGKYDEALAAFRQAQATKPHDQVRFAIASCLEKLARFVDARDAYQQIGTSDALNEAQRTEAGRAIARIDAVLATLVVTSALPEAMAVIDGQQRCSVPCTVRVDPRAHELEVRSGLTVLRRRVELSRGANVTVQLPPAEPGRPGPTAEPGPGALTWIGTGTAAIGLAGTVGFGLRATSIHERYFAAPTEDLRAEGMLMRDLTNVSIVTAVVGAVLVGIDTLLWTSAGRDTPGTQGEAWSIPVRGIRF